MSGDGVVKNFYIAKHIAACFLPSGIDVLANGGAPGSALWPLLLWWTWQPPLLFAQIQGFIFCHDHQGKAQAFEHLQYFVQAY